ncbi:PDZ domain-containing protein, partial [Acinetobacter baumannii]
SEQDKTDNKAMSDSLGLELTTLTPQIAAQIGVPQDTKGVVVVSVDPSSDAAQKSLQRGDIISSVNQQPVASVSDVVRA